MNKNVNSVLYFAVIIQYYEGGYYSPPPPPPPPPTLLKSFVNYFQLDVIILLIWLMVEETAHTDHNDNFMLKFR